MKITRTLVVRANGDMRLVLAKFPSLRPDEVAFPIEVNIPDTWGKLYKDQTISLTFPGVPAELRVGKRMT